MTKFRGQPFLNTRSKAWKENGYICLKKKKEYPARKNGKILSLNSVSIFLSPEAGFTLLELITILVVVALLLSISTRMISNFQSPIVSKKLVSDIRYAQQLAMTSGQRCGVAFDISGNSYTLFSGTPSSPATNPITQTSYVVQYGSGSYSDVNLLSANFNSTATLYFDTQGRPLDSGGTALSSNGTVLLNGSVTITVNQETGFTN